MSVKILVVEDHTDTRDMLEILLTREGFQVITAEDGWNGLAKASTDHPDVNLTDVHMPNLSGIDLIKALRHLPQTEHTPIVVMTADRDQQAAALEAGVDQFLKKPILVEKLFSTLKQLVELSIVILALINFCQ